MPIRVQPLTDRHKRDRKNFCEELLAKPENFVQKIIFGDEKNWVELWTDNKRNRHYWALENPNILEEVKQQGQTKYMSLVCMVNGKILDPFWFVNENGKPYTETGPIYLDVIQNHILPQISARDLRKYYWQQDG